MGIHRGPNMEKGGLIFGYDSGHGVCDNHTSSRFYQGKPTTNYLSNGLSGYNVVQGSRWNGATPTYTLGNSEFNTPIGTYNTSGTSYMYSHDYVLDDDLSTLSSQVVTFSIYLRRTNTLGTVGMRIYDNVSGYSTIYADVTGQFQRFSMTKTLGANPTRIFVMIDNTNGGIIDFHSPMLEKGEASPFVDGTRSSTESLIDLKRTADIDLSNTSFDSTGQPTFDGTNDYIDIINYTQHQRSTGTIEAVVRLDTISGNRYIFGAGGTNTYGATRALRVNSGYWGIVTYGSGTEDWGTGVAASTTDWQHVAFGWDGTTVYFYINGVRSSATRSGLVTPLGTTLRIGMPPWSVGSASDGQVAVIRHYPTVLTESEIKQNFNTYKKRFNI